jgi:hypothetical protein
MAVAARPGIVVGFGLLCDHGFQALGRAEVGWVRRAAKWLVTAVISAMVFGGSLWLAMAVKLPFLPRLDADRWVVAVGFASVMAACVLACGGWWAGRESEAKGAAPLGASVIASGDRSIAVGRDISGIASTGGRWTGFQAPVARSLGSEAAAGSAGTVASGKVVYRPAR